MKNKKSVENSLVDLISKIGEKINLRRAAFIDSKDTFNFSYTHSSLKKNGSVFYSWIILVICFSPKYISVSALDLIHL